jgi:hypothetical protein
MRIKGLLLLVLLLATGLTISGCTAVYPGDVSYQASTLRFTIQSDQVLPGAVLEVAVFRIGDGKQVEIFRNVDQYPLGAGNNPVTIPLKLVPGNYRCFIYVSSGTTRYPAVIRDFAVL